MAKLTPFSKRAKELPADAEDSRGEGRKGTGEEEQR